MAAVAPSDRRAGPQGAAGHHRRRPPGLCGVPVRDEHPAPRWRRHAPAVRAGRLLAPPGHHAPAPAAAAGERGARAQRAVRLVPAPRGRPARRRPARPRRGAAARRTRRRRGAGRRAVLLDLVGDRHGDARARVALLRGAPRPARRRARRPRAHVRQRQAGPGARGARPAAAGPAPVPAAPDRARAG
ncbi:Uncharacterised protein [Mycobacteroides abscessus]|nr:Uncharacterised protein [Mycobacteroides abscessus]